MKRFKIGFLSIIAILAMSFTIASNEGLIKKVTPDAKAPYQCKTADAVSVRLPDCSFLTCDQNKVGNCAYNLTLAAGNEVCDEIQDIFCCAELTNATCSPITCSGVVYTTNKKISVIHCKSANN